MKFLAKFITKFPIPIIIFILLFSLILGYGMRYLKINTNVIDAVPETMEVKRYFNEIGETFSTNDSIIVGIFTDNIFKLNIITLIDKLTNEFEKIKGVNDVISPTNVDYMKGSDEGLEISPILEKLPDTDQKMDEFKNKLLSTKLYKNMIFSQDNKVAGIIINLEDDCKNSEVYKEIKKIISVNKSTEEIFIAGEPSVLALLEITMVNNLIYLIPIVLIVIILILFFSFRSVRGIFLPLLTVIISTVVTLGIMGYLKIEMSILSTILPVVLIASGSAYGIHLINRYYEDIVSHLGKHEAISETIIHSGLAVFLAGITTVIGFASLCISNLELIRTFGFVSALGILIALIFSMLFIPAVLMIIPIPRTKKTKEEGNFGNIFLKNFASFIFEKKRIIVGFFIVFFILSILGTLRIKTDISMVNEFNKKSEIRIADKFINKYLMGTNNFSFVFETKENGGIKEPELLNKIVEFQKFVSQVEIVGGSRSFTDLIMEINKVMNEGNEEYYRIPDSRELIAQYMLLYSMSGDDEYIKNFIDYNEKKVRVIVSLKTNSVSDIAKFKKDTKSYIEKHFDKEKVEVKISGFSEILLTINNLLINSQILSIISSLIFVFIVVSIMFRSIIIGFISAIPIALTVIFNFGLMGILGIELNVETVLVASVAIGIGIDYTIHFLSRYEIERVLLNNNKEALIKTYQTTGKAIIINAVTVALGFIVIMFSEFRGLKYFGLFIAITMVTSSFNALSILPAILNLKSFHFVEKYLNPGKIIKDITSKMNKIN